MAGSRRCVWGSRPRRSPASRLARVLQLSRIVKADDAEIAVAAAALGCSESDLPGRFGIEELIVTRADRGGRIHLRGHGSFPYAPAPVRRVEDPTGAGDVFL